MAKKYDHFDIRLSEDIHYCSFLRKVSLLRLAHCQDIETGFEGKGPQTFGLLGLYWVFPRQVAADYLSSWH